MKKHVQALVVAAACLAATGFSAELAYAQRGGGAGRGRAGGAVGRAAPAVGRAVPRPGGGWRGTGSRGYRGGYRTGYRGAAYGAAFVGGPLYWGGVGWGSWGPGWRAWGPGWWGPGYAGSMWWPGLGWWGVPALYAPPVGMWGIASDARLLVTPRSTEVYVDGALAGVVDQFDGVFQSLRLAPGTHRITLYLAGHRKWEENVYVAPGSTLKVRHTMQALPAGAAEEERPTPRTGRGPAGSEPPAGPEAALPRPRLPRADHHPQGPQVVREDAGTLLIRVQPADAEIFVDGQRWQLPESDQPLEVRVPAGRVRVEVRRPGRPPFRTDVVVEPGQVTPVNVNLPERGEPI